MSDTPEDGSPIHDTVRSVSNRVRGNLKWILHRDQPRWGYPEPVSPIVQLLSSLTLLLALPLPELLAGVDAHPMTPRKRKLLEHPDFDVTNAEGFRAGIGSLRMALATSRCEFLIDDDRMVGLRAWEEKPLQPGVTSWELQFDHERLERVVMTMLEVLGYSGMPVTPQPSEPVATPRRPGTRRGGRKANQDEP